MGIHYGIFYGTYDSWVKLKPLPRISVSFAMWLPEICLLGGWKKYSPDGGEEW